MMFWSRRIAPVFLLVSACGGSDPSPAPPGPVTTDPIMMVIGPAGGEVKYGTATVNIPPGALTATVAITIARAARPEAGGAVGDWYELGPDGLVFEQPITIAIEVNEGDVPADGELAVGKYLVRPAREGGAEVSAMMVLDTSWDPERRVATGTTIGFSHVGPTATYCVEATTPAIQRAQWDTCAFETELAWASETNVLIEYGYRLGYGSPVTWIWAASFPPSSSYVFPAITVSGPVAPTWVFKAHTRSACFGQVFVSEDAVAEVPALLTLPPDAPEALFAQRTAVDSVTVRWRSPSALESQEDGYELLRSPTFTSDPRTKVLPDQNEYVDQDVTPSDVYFYSVRAFYDTCGDRRLYGPWTSVSTSTVPAPPEDVVGFTVSTATAGAVRLDWMPAVRATEYLITRTGGAPLADVVVQTPVDNYLDEAVEPATTYTYTLTARNQDGSSATATATITTPMVASSTAQCGDVRLTVRPTPVITQVQAGNCNPGDPGCPDDASFEVIVERLNGSTEAVDLTAWPDAASWPILEFLLGNFGGRLGAPNVTLSGGTPSETTTYEVRTPEYAVASMPLPVTWAVTIRAQPASGGTPCEVPIELVVQP